MIKFKISHKIILFGILIIVIIYLTKQGNKSVQSTSEFFLAERYIKQSKEIDMIVGGFQSVDFMEGGKASGNSPEEIWALYKFKVSGETANTIVKVWIYKSESCNNYMIKAELQFSQNAPRELSEICEVSQE